MRTLGTAVAAVLLLIGFFASTSFSQQYFKTWTTKNGLPQNNIVNIAQTPDGHIWVATLDGLARFDGVRFKIFNKSNTPEMPNNRIFSMFADAAGRLWINYANEQTVVVYEAGKFRRFEKMIDFERDETLSPDLRFGIDRFRHLLQNPKMTFRSGENEYVFSDGRFQSQAAQDRGFPAKVFAADDRSVWIEETDAFFHIEGEKVTRYGKDVPLPVTPKDTIPMDFAERDGVLWCAAGGTLDTVSLISFKDGKIKRFPRIKEIYEVEFDTRGDLLVSAVGRVVQVNADKIVLNDPSDFPLTPLLDESGARIFQDRGENLWVGGSQGLHLANSDPAITFYSAKSQPPIENVYPIVQDNEGTIWFAAWQDYRLFSYRDGTFNSEYGYILTSLFVDNRARVWKGTNGSAAYRENGSWEPYDYEKNLPPPWNDRSVFTGELSFITEDGTGTRWFGTEAGLIRDGTPESRLFTVADGLPANVVTSYLITRSGEMWIGTNAGIARLEGDKFRSFTEADGLAGNYTRSFYEDVDGTIWIGGYDGGLTRYKGGEFKKITKRDGLFSDGVFVILEDDAGWFWMNSNQGIYRVRRQELNDFADGGIDSVTSVSYGPEDGLVEVEGNGGKQPAGLKARDGRLWFPMAKGVAVVDPKQVKREVAPPPVLIVETRIDGKSVETPRNEIRLEPSQVAVEIDYTALGFVGAERTRFRYRLEDLEEAWTEAGTRRTAYFSHLPAGAHVFRVTAANDSGVWNNEGAAFQIIVIPPFYRTWWFYVLVVIGIVSLVTLIYLLRLRQLKTLSETRASFARQLIESQESERHRVALELHDSIGQTLAVIKNRALLGLDADDGASKMRSQLEQISDASTLALEETREIARNLHPAQIENLGLTAALRTLAASVESATGLKCKSEITEISQGDLPYDASINIYRIAQESLSNIIKHSGASQASISLRNENGRLTLAIEDDGRGFSTTSARNGLGLAGMRERSRIIGAKLRIDSLPSEGTTIRLTLPLQNH